MHYSEEADKWWTDGEESEQGRAPASPQTSASLFVTLYCYHHQGEGRLGWVGMGPSCLAHLHISIYLSPPAPDVLLPHFQMQMLHTRTLILPR